MDNAYSEEEKAELEKKIKGSYDQLGDELNASIDDIKNNRLTDLNEEHRTAFKRSSISQTQKEICNVNGIYVMLKEEGANVGSFSDFYVKAINDGGVTKDSNGNFVWVADFHKLVKTYSVNGRELELKITTNNNNMKNANIKMGAAKNTSHMWNVGFDKSNNQFVADPWYNGNALWRSDYFGQPAHGRHTPEKYFYLEKK
jgi:hypothetical protein